MGPRGSSVSTNECKLHVFSQTAFAALRAGAAGGAGSCSFAEGEGRGGGQAGGTAGQEGEGDPEEGHQEGEAETQDHLQGSVPSRSAAALVVELNLQTF